MNNEINFLITLSDDIQLHRVAIKTTPNMFSDFESVVNGYYLELDVKEQFFKLLPAHVKSIGKIVEVEEIFELKDLTK